MTTHPEVIEYSRHTESEIISACHGEKRSFGMDWLTLCHRDK
jgi:hypothetical protein